LSYHHILRCPIEVLVATFVFLTGTDNSLNVDFRKELKMTLWQTTLDIKDLHEAYKAGTMDIRQVAAGVAKRLQRNKYAEDLDSVIIELEEIGCDAQTSLKELTNEYDCCLDEICDFGDFEHRIWVKAF
jgi:hypothetical protein